MARPDNNPTDQVTVLQAVVSRLIREVDKFTDTNCFLTAEPPDEPPANVRNNVFCTVSPTNSKFDQDALVGGGLHTVFEEAGVQIVIFNSVKLDRVGHDSALLTEASRGLLILKKQILKALSDHDLQDGNGKEILINLMAPLLSENPRSSKGKEGAVGDLSLQFSTDFEWDLT